MELWVNSLNKVYLEDVPDASGVTASWTKDGVTQGALTPTETSGDAWSATIPYIQSECDIAVTWSFTVVGQGSFQRTDNYTVVTPILTRREILGVWSTATDQQILDIEQAVRLQVQAYTGQTFGKRTKTLVVNGNGDDALALPERLMSLTGLATLTATLDTNAVITIADGWYLKRSDDIELTTFDSSNLYFTGASDVNWRNPYVAHGPAIRVPSNTPTPLRWTDDYPYSITGTWGYSEVPTPVKAAAKLLVNDYACSEQSYRDRYLESIKSADWRLQFKDGAYRRTGNVRADQLLDDYVKFEWLVI